MLSRGRSTQVSKTAIARRASFERTRQHPVPATASSSPVVPLNKECHIHNDSTNDDNNDYDSPPSLEDQVHIAYALDNIHLAKILLLKLTGIHVTDDNDPRIAAVQDKDFDFCFAPAGNLTLDIVDQTAVLNAQRKEHERWQAQLRLDRLRACERIWDNEKRRLRRQRFLFLRDREHAIAREKQRQREERDRLAELERRRYQDRLRSTASVRTRGLVSYSSLPILRAHDARTLDSPSYLDEPLQYAFMSPSTSRSSKLRCPKSPPAAQPSLSQDPDNAVSFKDVLTSMHGPLFPPDTQHSPTHSSILNSELFDILLQPVQPHHNDRTQDKKEKAPRLERNPSYRSVRRVAAQCAACSASAVRGNTTFATSTSPSSTCASSTPSRSGSWLSFSSRASTSTAPTSPSTSPISSWLKRSSYLSTFPDATNPKLDNESRPFPPLRHSCHSRLTRIDITASPLDLIGTKQKSYQHSGPQYCQDQDKLQKHQQQSGCTDNAGTKSRRKSLVINIAESMSCFLELAKGLNVTTAMFSVTIDSQHLSLLPSPNVTQHSNGLSYPLSAAVHAKHLDPITTRCLKPVGYRVTTSAVSVFTSIPNEESELGPSPLFIPLLPTRDKQHYALYYSTSSPNLDASPSNSTTIPRLRTPLPNPPPSRVFPPPPPIPRSPLRPRDPLPVGAVLLRVRPVANPALLRLRALQNVICERGVEWEGRAREGGLGAGRERLCRVAFEGLGRSALACEVRQWVS